MSEPPRDLKRAIAEVRLHQQDLKPDDWIAFRMWVVIALAEAAEKWQRHEKAQTDPKSQ